MMNDEIENALGELVACFDSNGTHETFDRSAARRILRTLVREARVGALREAFERCEYAKRILRGPHVDDLLNTLRALIADAEESGR